MRPGVFDVRARLWRPVSALTSEDLPTFERPAKAISGAPIGGRPSDLAAAKKKSHGPANSLRPASISCRVGVAGRELVHVGRALVNILVRLSHSSTFTPFLRMMKYC